jgi:hypothetical protein
MFGNLLATSLFASNSVQNAIKLPTDFSNVKNTRIEAHTRRLEEADTRIVKLEH